jgi:hypothetical protein
VVRQAREGAEKVNLGQVLVAKFPLFVLGFILLFLLSTTGMFMPERNDGKGKYMDPVKAKALKDEQIVALQEELPRVADPDEQAALQRLIETKKVQSRKDDTLLRSLAAHETTAKPAVAALKDAHKNAWMTAPRVAWFRDVIVWFFAFGLTGLGMQITLASIRQAGGDPLVIGGVVGTAKAVLSLIVVLLFVHETI